MIPMTVTLDIEAAPWGQSSDPDISKGHSEGLGNIIAIGRLPRGTVKGNSTVSVAIKMPNGKVYWAETTAMLFLGAAKAIEARESVERDGNA